MGTIFGEIFGPTSGGGGPAKDTTPPTIAVVSPTPGVVNGQPGGFSSDPAIARTTPIIIDITDATPGLLYVCIVCSYPGSVDGIEVYRRGAFRGSFFGSSSVAAIANGLRFTILPNGGWPDALDPATLTDIRWDVDAIDGDGNLAA